MQASFDDGRILLANHLNGNATAAHLDHAVGNLTPADYRHLRRQCLRAAAAAMRAMHLEPDQEDAMLARLES